MTRTRAFSLLACTALAAAMTIGAATPADAACRAPVRGAQLSGINQTLTEFRARSSWRTRVRAIHGYRFGRWSYARNKNMDCNKDRPGRTWHCRAIASPCDRPPRTP
jgi:hypothetical protein